MNTSAKNQKAERAAPTNIVECEEHIIEIVSDSGEGAQKAGQAFGAISAKMGNGVWTVEIIPAEIQPPARTREGASGIRIRIGSRKITNIGDQADLVIAFNEVVPYSRIEKNAYKKGTLMLIENKWAKDVSEDIRNSYKAGILDFQELGMQVWEIPFEEECLKWVKDARKGKNMWVLGLLCAIYQRDLGKAEAQIRHIFRKKKEEVVQNNLQLLKEGYKWGEKQIHWRFIVPTMKITEPQVVMNGNEAISLGIMASGMEVCSMYPITPATSVTHHLAERIEDIGGFIHQAEDEIAAIGFAIGSSYAGKTAVTVTSGPGLALKTEFIGLAAMAEIPLVIVDVQRGGPSTGLPTKVEQGDLLAVLYGTAGDAPKIVLAAATIEECFQFIILARKLAETFRCPVFVLSDANLATGVQPFTRPVINLDWFSLPIDQSPWKKGIGAYQWNKQTGMSKRPVPGQVGGEYTLTGLAHNEQSKVSYYHLDNERAMSMRSKKLATLAKTLKPPRIHGAEEGDLLLVGWGSTKGAIEEAVSEARKSGAKVSSVHLHFMSPLEPGLKKIFSKFRKVMTVEINYCDDKHDDAFTEDSRRYSQLAWLLRARTLKDIESYSHVYGLPLSPGEILSMISEELRLLQKKDTHV